ncbi:MAG: hypothetical protein ACX933_18305, partial [Marinobacter adhaerens]
MVHYFRNCFTPPQNNENLWLYRERNRMKECGVTSAQEFLAHLPVLNMRQLIARCPTYVDMASMKRTIAYTLSKVEEDCLPELVQILILVHNQFAQHYDLPDNWAMDTARVLAHIEIRTTRDYLVSSLEIPLLLAQSSLPSIDILIRHAISRCAVHSIYPNLPNRDAFGPPLQMIPPYQPFPHFPRNPSDEEPATPPRNQDATNQAASPVDLTES